MSEKSVLSAAPAEAEAIDTGVKAKAREAIAQDLSAVLASTYLLTIKSHLYHWNVVGPLFKPIHDLTEEHYEDLFAAADVIAERIRALGHRAPVDAAHIRMDLDLKTPGTGMPDAHAMIADLVKDHETIIRTMRKAAKSAGDADDLVSEDMLVGRLTFHEKAAWMLRALIAE